MFPSGLFDRKPTTGMSAFYDPNLEKHPKIIRSQFGQISDVKKSAHTQTRNHIFLEILKNDIRQTKAIQKNGHHPAS